MATLDQLEQKILCPGKGWRNLERGQRLLLRLVALTAFYQRLGEIGVRARAIDGLGRQRDTEHSNRLIDAFCVEVDTPKRRVGRGVEGIDGHHAFQGEVQTRRLSSRIDKRGQLPRRDDVGLALPRQRLERIRGTGLVTLLQREGGNQRIRTVVAGRIWNQLCGTLERGNRDQSLPAIERALERAAGVETNHLTRRLPFLATTASATPFIGLFGTVWGILGAFRQIGITGSTSIVTVAPGIAEALVNTAAGLVAAVPALIAYNYLNGRVRITRSEMRDFALEFLNLAERHFT